MDGRAIDLDRMAADEERLRFPALPETDDDDELEPSGPAVKRFKDAAEILSIPDIEYRDVWVPEWDTHVKVRGLSQLERDRIIDTCRRGKGRKEKFDATGMEAKFVIAAALKPEDSTPMFGPEHLYPLMRKSAGAVHRIYVVVEQMCGFDADADAEDPLAATRGKSSPTPNGASPFA